MIERPDKKQPRRAGGHSPVGGKDVERLAVAFGGAECADKKDVWNSIAVRSCDYCVQRRAGQIRKAMNRRSHAASFPRKPQGDKVLVIVPGRSPDEVHMELRQPPGSLHPLQAMLVIAGYVRLEKLRRGNVVVF